MQQHNDAQLLRGIGAIVNVDNIKPGIDLKELERQMIDGGVITQKVKDPQDKLMEELQSTAAKLGISFDDKSGGGNSSSVPAPTPLNNVSAPTWSSPSYTSAYDEDEADDTVEADNKSADTRADYNDDSDEEENRFASADRPRFSNLQNKTYEQVRRSHIDSVVGGSESTDFSFDMEKKEDMKCAMLAEIDSLLTSLADEDIDLTRIPRVSQNSSYEDVESVLRILRYKNDQTRYCSFAEEFIMFGAYGLEEIFNGKRTWLGQYRPDLTGWHNTVNVKLKRMRHDTGQIVSGIMQDNHISPLARIMLELLPNMVLYSKMRQQQHGQADLFMDANMTHATQNL